MESRWLEEGRGKKGSFLVRPCGILPHYRAEELKPLSLSLSWFVTLLTKLHSVRPCRSNPFLVLLIS